MKPTYERIEYDSNTSDCSYIGGAQLIFICLWQQEWGLLYNDDWRPLISVDLCTIEKRNH